MRSSCSSVTAPAGDGAPAEVSVVSRATPLLGSETVTSCDTRGALDVSVAPWSGASTDFLSLSCEARGDEGAFGLCCADGAGAALSVELRFGTSKLCRGLAVGVGFAEDPSALPAACFAATALASRSCSRSFGLLLVESDLDGAVPQISQHALRDSSAGVPVWGGSIPVLGLDCWEGVGLGVGLGWSSSARMVSRRASTPATACERSEPHLDLPPPPWADMTPQ